MDGQAMREMTPEEKEVALKPWAELTLEQQVERLRTVLSRCSQLPAEVISLRQNMTAMQQHQHGPSGQLMMPFQQNPGMGGIGMLARKESFMENQYNRLY